MASEKIVVVGGGIIGTSIVYYLSKMGYKNVTLIDRCDIGCAASGKSGGFLAKDWCAGTSVDKLAKRSFQLHQEFATAVGHGEIDYRKLDTFETTVNSGNQTKRDTVTFDKTNTDKSKYPSTWLDGGVQQKTKIGSLETTAQVHPKKLAQTLFKESRNLNENLILLTGALVDIKTENAEVVSLQVDNETLSCDKVVFAMGPWTGQITQWIRAPPVTGTRAHSIVMDAENVPPEALFLDYQVNLKGMDHSPEVYPRPDGTVYMCGFTDKEPLPADPATVPVDLESCERLKVIAGDVSSVLKKAEVLTSQACYLPYSDDGLPIIGKLHHYTNAYIASAHTCWGILNSHATGEAIAELLLGRSTTVDLGDFSPSRFEL